MIHQLIYSSSAADSLTDSDLEDLLSDSRRDNAERNVTGALIFVDRVFVQVLEGSRQAIADLMVKIERDPRHDSITVFHEGETEERIFDSWRMAFLSPNPDEVAKWSGLPGTGTIEDVIGDLERHPERVPEALTGIVKALNP